MYFDWLTVVFSTISKLLVGPPLRIGKRSLSTCRFLVGGPRCGGKKSSCRFATKVQPPIHLFANCCIDIEDGFTKIAIENR